MRFFKGHKPPFRGVAYRPDGRTLITATQTGFVTLWDLDAGRELTRLTAKPNSGSGVARLDALALSPDGRLLAAVGDSLTVWNLDTGAIGAGFEYTSLHPLQGAAFALGGSRLVAGISSGWQTGYLGYGLALWDTADGAALPVFRTTGSACVLAVSPDGRSVFGGASHQTVRWHLPTEREFRTPLHPQLYSLAVSPVAGVMAQGVYRMVELRDASGERLLAQWDAHKKGVFALAFSADGTLLATGGGDEVVKVWDVSGVARVLADPGAAPLTSMPERAAYEWGLGPVRALAFSPDGLTAAAVGDRVKFVVWDVE